MTRSFESWRAGGPPGRTFKLTAEARPYTISKTISGQKPSSFLGRMSFFLLFTYILKFTCYTFSGCVLNIFPTSCRFFFRFKYVSSFCMHNAPKTSSRRRHYFPFLSQRKVSYFMLFICFNIIKYFWILLQLYITVIFGKKKRNETTNLELICDLR